MPTTRSRYKLDELGPLLDTAIQEAGLTMTEAAEELGCTDRHLRRVRAGDYPKAAAEYLRRLGHEVHLYAEVKSP